jgi:hypothetical protein
VILHGVGFKSLYDSIDFDEKGEKKYTTLAKQEIEQKIKETLQGLFKEKSHCRDATYCTLEYIMTIFEKKGGKDDLLKNTNQWNFKKTLGFANSIVEAAFGVKFFNIAQHNQEEKYVLKHLCRFKNLLFNLSMDTRNCANDKVIARKYWPTLNLPEIEYQPRKVALYNQVKQLATVEAESIICFNEEPSQTNANVEYEENQLIEDDPIFEINPNDQTKKRPTDKLRCSLCFKLTTRNHKSRENAKSCLPGKAHVWVDNI